MQEKVLHNEMTDEWEEGLCGRKKTAQGKTSQSMSVRKDDDALFDEGMSIVARMQHQ